MSQLLNVLAKNDYFLIRKNGGQFTKNQDCLFNLLMFFKKKNKKKTRNFFIKFYISEEKCLYNKH